MPAPRPPQPLLRRAPAGQVMAAEHGEKLTKDAADYRAFGTDDPHVRCGSCSMYRPPFGCTLVAGSINAGAICAFWEQKGSDG